jgi:hypothetical protein
MSDKFEDILQEHIRFSYSSFDRILLRGYLPNLFVEGSIINLLRNLGFKKHSNGVLKLLTDQLNSHIQKTAQNLGVLIHWWSSSENEKYHSKLDFVTETYSKKLSGVCKKDRVLCIIKALENVRTFSNKEVKTNSGKTMTKMYSCNKFVSQYYIYVYDQILGLCYLKISSYLPFHCEFYMNGHSYLKQQFDLLGSSYTMKNNSFTEVTNVSSLQKLVNDFQPSTILKRINSWMDLFFRFDKGTKSTRSKLLSHNWYTYQTEVSTNIIFKSEKFTKSFFNQVLSKHHSIGLPDRLTKIFGLSKSVNNSKSVQRLFSVQACIKHWLEKNSIKCYNKNGCLLRVETTINNPDLPGLKLKKPACNLQAYYWYGHACNSRYLNTISDIDLDLLNDDIISKYQEQIITKKGYKVPAPDLRNKNQMNFLIILINSKFLSMGFRNRDLRKKLGNEWKTAKIAYELRKLRERGAVKKLKNTQYYQLTKEGYTWLYYSIFNYSYFVNPLLSASCKMNLKKASLNPSNIEKAYRQINESLNLILSELQLAA